MTKRKTPAKVTKPAKETKADNGGLTEERVVPLLMRSGWYDGRKSIDEAVKEYQEFHGLLVDGVVGPKTFRSLTMARFCALPDNFTAPRLNMGQINRWGKKRLKIECQGSLGRLTDDQFREGTIAGFRLWSEVAEIDFDLVNSGGDIVIDTGRIDGPQGVLAFMQLPMADGHTDPLHGRDDDDEAWNQTIPLVTVTAHEGGHALGLGHTNVPRQLMNPTLSNLTKPQAAWDIPEIRKRYGERTNAPPPAPVPGPIPGPGTFPGGPAVIQIFAVEFDGQLFVNGRRVTL